MATITPARLTSHSGLSTPTSSRRTSFDTTQTGSPARTAAINAPQARRNRAALRDYYGLKNAAAPADAVSVLHHDEAQVKESELDGEGFDAQQYVKEMLRKESLGGVLRVEEEILNEIKGLDGERKALVYDNYSKLITATDTIRKMRTNMDPLTPTTSTLSPAIAHIASTASNLATVLQEHVKAAPPANGVDTSDNAGPTKEKQRQTVKWVLDTPRRLKEQVEKGEKESAMRDWSEVEKLLNLWQGTEGVEQVRKESLKALEQLEDSKDVA